MHRFARVACHPPEADIAVFRTSGTTHGERGQHPLRELSLYHASARPMAKRWLFPDVDALPLILLAPRPEDAPDSSLSHMLGRFTEWFGEGQAIWAFSDGRVDIAALERGLADASAAGTPVALLGTSFAFVHADDALSARFTLAPGSRIMQTGGFKGRSREVSPDEMRAMLSARFGVPESHIVSEYGMTELSSQAYETTLRQALIGDVDGPRRLIFPTFCRATPVDPETLAPVPMGQEGILRIDDPANLDSVAAIQTSDRARLVDDGFVVLGRSPGAVPRGCSLAIEEAL